MYYCAVPTCGHHKLQPLYCFLCVEDEPPKHDHRPKIIAVKSDNTKADWQELRSKVNKSATQAKKWYDAHNVLIDQLTVPEVQSSQAFKTHYEELQLLEKDLDTLYSKEISELLAKDKVLELQQKDQQFKEFTQKYEGLVHLTEISLKTLWRYYKKTIPNVGLKNLGKLSKS